MQTIIPERLFEVSSVAIKRTFRVVTQYRPKPIPDFRFDWEASPADYDEGDPIGYGRTEQEAIDDLMSQLEDEE